MTESFDIVHVASSSGLLEDLLTTYSPETQRGQWIFNRNKLSLTTEPNLN